MGLDMSFNRSVAKTPVATGVNQWLFSSPFKVSIAQSRKRRLLLLSPIGRDNKLSLRVSIAQSRKRRLLQTGGAFEISIIRVSIAQSRKRRLLPRNRRGEAFLLAWEFQSLSRENAGCYAIWKKSGTYEERAFQSLSRENAGCYEP